MKYLNFKNITSLALLSSCAVACSHKTSPEVPNTPAAPQNTSSADTAITMLPETTQAAPPVDVRQPFYQTPMTVRSIEKVSLIQLKQQCPLDVTRNKTVAGIPYGSENTTINAPCYGIALVMPSFNIDLEKAASMNYFENRIQHDVLYDRLKQYQFDRDGLAYVSHPGLILVNTQTAAREEATAQLEEFKKDIQELKKPTAKRQCLYYFHGIPSTLPQNAEPAFDTRDVAINLFGSYTYTYMIQGGKIRFYDPDHSKFYSIYTYAASKNDSTPIGPALERVCFDPAKAKEVAEQKKREQEQTKLLRQQAVLPVIESIGDLSTFSIKDLCYRQKDALGLIPYKSYYECHAVQLKDVVMPQANGKSKRYPNLTILINAENNGETVARRLAKRIQVALGKVDPKPAYSVTLKSLDILSNPLSLSKLNKKLNGETQFAQITYTVQEPKKDNGSSFSINLTHGRLNETNDALMDAYLLEHEEHDPSK